MQKQILKYEHTNITTFPYRQELWGGLAPFFLVTSDAAWQQCISFAFALPSYTNDTTQASEAITF
jgi:hypothetical protein